MKYGYVRVSSISQNVDRQVEEMKKNNIDMRDIYIDKESGKDFNRKNYQILKKRLKIGDLVIIKSIDRLGRNYQAIINEWYDITKIKKADILVIDMPLLDTRNDNNNLIGRFISDIVLQILSFVSENERVNIKQRQAEGIKLAKVKGVKFGKKRYEITDKYKDITKKYMLKEISLSEALLCLEISKSTFYKYINT